MKLKPMDRVLDDLAGMKPRERRQHLEKHLQLAEARLAAQMLESQQWLFSGNASDLNAEDPLSDDGLEWTLLSGMDVPSVTAMRNAQALTKARNMGRQLATENPFAIGFMENMASFVCGTGFSWSPVWKGKPEDEPEDLTAAIKEELEAFDEENRAAAKEQEAVIRGERDGEFMLRYFRNARGPLRIRWVEPVLLRAPRGGSGSMDDALSFGVEVDPSDRQQVIAYHVDDERVQAINVEHAKLNVDETLPRGWPTTWAIRNHLSRAEKLQRNMGHVSALQAAIALIRKHTASTKAEVQTFLDSNRDALVQTAAGKNVRYKYFGPGAIIDQGPGYTYEAPVSSVNASNGVLVVQGELRACAARVRFPEFMFTTDASNANYSSTMVAESPAVKNLERRQASAVAVWRNVRRRAIANAVLFGRLPKRVLKEYDIQGEGPGLETRDKLAEAQEREIERVNGVVSTKTWRLAAGYDHETEERNMAEERAAASAGMADPLAAGDPDEPLDPIDPDADPAGAPEPGAQPAAGALPPPGHPMPAPPGSPPGTAGSPSPSLQERALAAGQVTALLAIVKAVVDEEIPAEAGVSMILMAFPTLPRAEVETMIAAAEKHEPPPEPVPVIAGPGGKPTARPAAKPARPKPTK